MNIWDNMHTRLDLSSFVSADDQTPPIFGGGGGAAFNSFADSNTGVDVNTGIVPGKPDAAQFMQSLALPAPDGTTTPPIVVTTTTSSGAPIVSVSAGTVSMWQRIVNFFTLSVPAAVSGSYARLKSALGGSPSASSSTAKVAAPSDSSWMLWVLLAGGAAAIYYATKGKKGGKSILSKLGSKSSVKLH